MKIFILLAFLLIISAALLAQVPPDTLWTHTYQNYGEAHSVVQTTDGGFALAGSDRILKMDVNGIEEWSQTYVGQNYVGLFSIQQTIDNGYIAAGNTSAFLSSSSDLWLLKTDENGVEEWNHAFGAGNYNDSAFSVQQTIDGGYIVGGRTNSFGAGNSDFWLLKTDEDGVEEWSQTFGGTGYEEAYYTQQTTDGGYIIAGNTSSFGAGSDDIWLVKTDEDGNEEWNQTYGGAGHESGNSAQQTSDGGYILAGSTSSLGDEWGEFWLVKTDADGNEEWNQTFFGRPDAEFARSVRQTVEGGYIVIGISVWGAGASGLLAIETDSNGIMEWSLGYSTISNLTALDVKQTSDEGYIICGSVDDETNLWVMRLDDYVAEAGVFVNQPTFFINNHPNPFNPSTNILFSIPDKADIDISVYNMKGQRVKALIKESYGSGEHSVIWNGDDESGKPVGSGIYFYKFNVNGKNEAVKKCLLLK